VNPKVSKLNSLNFLIEDFFSISPPVSLVPVWFTLSFEYFPRIFEKIEVALMLQSGAPWEMIHEKPEANNLVALSLQVANVLMFCQILTNDKPVLQSGRVVNVITTPRNYA
jgi:hypothetical protein